MHSSQSTQSNPNVESTIVGMTDKTASGLQKLGGTAQAAVDRIGTAATTAAQRVSEQGTRLAAASQRYADTSREYVRKHPIASVGIALGVGMLIAGLTTRAKRWPH